MRPAGRSDRTRQLMALELANEIIGRCGLVIRVVARLPVSGNIDYTLVGRLALERTLLSSKVASGAVGVGPMTTGVFMVSVGVIPRVMRPSGKPKGVILSMGLPGKCCIIVT